SVRDRRVTRAVSWQLRRQDGVSRWGRRLAIRSIALGSSARPATGKGVLSGQTAKEDRVGHAREGAVVLETRPREPHQARTTGAREPPGLKRTWKIGRRCRTAAAPRPPA